MIAVDYFRQIPGFRPPLACFLSHVHSDHLAGLETLKSPLYVIRQDAERHVLIWVERVLFCGNERAPSSTRKISSQT